jgi:hypothetical protein
MVFLGEKMFLFPPKHWREVRNFVLGEQTNTVLGEQTNTFPARGAGIHRVSSERREFYSAKTLGSLLEQLRIQETVI